MWQQIRQRAANCDLVRDDDVDAVLRSVFLALQKKGVLANAREKLLVVLQDVFDARLCSVPEPNVLQKVRNEFIPLHLDSAVVLGDDRDEPVDALLDRFDLRLDHGLLALVERGQVNEFVVSVIDDQAQMPQNVLLRQLLLPTWVYFIVALHELLLVLEIELLLLLVGAELNQLNDTPVDLLKLLHNKLVAPLAIILEHAVLCLALYLIEQAHKPVQLNDV